MRTVLGDCLCSYNIYTYEDFAYQWPWLAFSRYVDRQRYTRKEHINKERPPQVHTPQILVCNAWVQKRPSTI
ncbi:unnamed protein product, partial [Iphiclides podalirius]